MNILLDIALIAIVLLAIFFGVKKGFARATAGLVGFIIALLLAYFFAAPAGDFADEKIVRPFVVDQLIKTQGEGVTKDTPAGEVDIVKINEKLQALFGKDNEIGKTDEQPSLGEWLDTLLRDQKITLAASRAIGAIGVFLAATLLLFLLRFLLRPVLKLPVLKQCDKILGAAVGIVNALILVFLFTTAVYGFAHFSDKNFEAETVEKTAVFKIAYEHNPIRDIIEAATKK